MRGDLLALGAVSGLVAAGLARTRGTANVSAFGWPDAVPYALRMRAADIAERVRNDTRRGREGYPRRVPREMGTYLGEGETRIVYALDPDFVVKIPQDRHHNGYNQNEAAIWAKASPGLRELLVPVLAADPSGAWLIMPRIRSRLDDAEYRRAQQLCDAVERYVTTRYSDCEEGQNVGARADGRLFLFDYPFDPDDIPD